MTELQDLEKSLRDLIDIIHFTEHVSQKIHGVVEEVEIYRTVREEFAQSKRYTVSILLLTPDASRLRIAETSLTPEQAKEGEKLAGIPLRGYEIDLDKSSIYRQVVREGETIQVSVADIVSELFPRALAVLITRALGYHKRPSILTPLKRRGEIIGAFNMSSVELADYFIPSVRSLAQHISNALELADEYSERHRVEQALRESEERYRDLVEKAGIAIAIDDEEGNLKYFNERFAELFGYSFEEMKEQSHRSLIHPDDLNAVTKYHEERLRGKEVPSRYEFTGIRKDGVTIHLGVNVVEVKEGDRVVGTRSYLQDLTERKRAEEALKEYSQRLEDTVQELRDTQEQLIRKERLAVLGELAGGVGHELRNPLGVISNAIYYLQMTHEGADDTTQEYMEIISSEVRNADKIISDLLEFSRTKLPEREETLVTDLIADVLDRPTPPKNVQVTTHTPSDLPPVFVDPKQIGQVLLNLVINGYQAMPDGGELTISADSAENKVYLSITDTGVGIPPGNAKKVFEPLFSTKARGIGLGLAVSKMLLEANGGSIEVDSEEGKGSTFTIALPRAEARA